MKILMLMLMLMLRARRVYANVLSMLSLRRGMATLLALSALGAAASASQQVPAPPPAATAPLAGAPAQASPSARATQPASALPGAVSAATARRDAWKCLTDGAAEKDADHRAQAIVALGTVGIRPDVVRLVEDGLTDKNITVRQAAATALGVMKSRGSIPKLRVALDDESPVVIFAAAQALWQMGDKGGEEIFLDVLDGDRKVSRGTVKEGLHYAHEQLQDRKALAELGAEQTAGAFLGPFGFSVSVVAELAKDNAAPARALSARLLGDGGDTDSREGLQQALEDKSWLVRATAAEALGVKGDASVVAKLAPLLNEDRREVRYQAAAAIMRITARR